MAREYYVARVGEIPEGSHRLVEVNGRKVGVFNVRGHYYGLPSFCIHQGGPLCKGVVSGTVVAGEHTNWQLQWEYDGEIISCPWHGLEFNITTGECLAFPRCHLRVYSVIVENGEIRVAI